MQDLLNYAFSSFLSLAVIMGPLSTMSVFLSLTKGMKKSEKYRIAFLTSVTCFLLLVFFAITGYWIFQLFSITLDSFRIAGGLALTAIGFRMLFPDESHHTHGNTFGQIYIVPLGIPMSAGPAAMTATVVLAGNAISIFHTLTLIFSIFFASSLIYYTLKFSERIDKFLGKDGKVAMVKIMGLIVIAVAIEFIVTGLKAHFPVLG
jgi:multiple antibiotic resistance protein